jgi:hypothetical protein
MSALLTTAQFPPQTAPLDPREDETDPDPSREVIS